MKTRRAALVLVVVAGSIGCEAPLETAEQTAGSAERIVNGAAVINTTAAMSIAIAAGFTCSAVLISSNWALSARHCFTDSNGNIRSPISQYWTTRNVSPGLSFNSAIYNNQIVQLREFHPAAWQVTNGAQDPEDIALLLLNHAETGWWPLYNGYANINLNVTLLGYGDNDATTNGGAGTLRQAQTAVLHNIYTTFTSSENNLGQSVWFGDSGGPTTRVTDVLGRIGTGNWVLGVHQAVYTDTHVSQDAHIDALRSWIRRARFVQGDVNGDGRSDITLTGVQGWTTLPYGLSNGDGTFSFSGATNPFEPNFPIWATQTGAKPVTGDFNGDGVSDVALTGGQNWGTLPLALANSDGTFTEFNNGAGLFPTYAAQAGALPVSGDFDGDGRDDIALTAGVGWGSIPVAFSQGPGIWSVTNTAVANFPIYTTQAGAKPLAGDFDGDGRDDIAATGGVNWASIPYAFSNGDGSFTVLNYAQPTFATWAQQQGATPVTGDFDGDGRTDIALVGGTNWTTIPVAFSTPSVLRDGETASFQVTVTNQTVNNFPSWAQTPGVKVIAGDFDGDRRDDIALLGVSGWTGVRIAFSTGNGNFTAVNLASTAFANGAADFSTAKPLANHNTGH